MPKKRARTRKSEDNDTVDLASDHDGSFDVKLAAKKAHDVAAGDKAFLAPGWHRDDTVEQKQKKVFEIFYAHVSRLG